jgi:DHA1 family bicyclomycin/chloramphenicol resistance-like MFS transporter
MKLLKQHNTVISTVLAFALIPLSGFATDIYLPSFPAMAAIFGTAQSDIQLSLAVFVVANGIGQLFVGGLLDSFGRYRLSLISLVIFALSSFVIAITDNVTVLLSMRVIQGLAVALIVVAKRAFFIDVYSGSQLKHYTSLFSIMWATAPVIAPFVGGFLQHYFGWESNFYFLALITIAILVLELVYSGETLKTRHPFHAGNLLNVYASKLKTPDFAISLVILGSAFGVVTVYNMASPFIIQHVFHQSAVTIGNCSLVSGLALMAGGLTSKRFINHSLSTKMMIAGPLLSILAILMIVVMYYFPNLIALMTLIVLSHMVGGFTFNTFYTYALGRFSSHAGVVSGIVGGVTYILASVLGYAVVSALQIHDAITLGFAYLILAVIIGVSFILFVVVQRRSISKESQPVPALQSIQ